MNKFKLKILTPDEKLFDGEVSQVVLPTKAGEITVLANHIPLISLLSIGEIKITTSPDLSLQRRGESTTSTKPETSQVQKFLVQGGVLDVKQKPALNLVEGYTEVVILADEKLDDSNIDLQKFEESVKRAKDANQEDHSAYDPDLLEGLTERSAYFKRMKG